jgi:hypothetical protein
MATWGIWFFVIGRRTLTSDLRENGVKTLVCVCVCVCVSVLAAKGRLKPKVTSPFDGSTTVSEFPLGVQYTLRV